LKQIQEIIIESVSLYQNVADFLIVWVFDDNKHITHADLFSSKNKTFLRWRSLCCFYVIKEREYASKFYRRRTVWQVKLINYILLIVNSVKFTRTEKV